MKKIFLYLLLALSTSLSAQIKVKDLPTTTTGTSSDYLLKDDAAGIPGSTKKISVGNFISAYSLGAQSLSISSNTLSISGGNSVVLPSSSFSLTGAGTTTVTGSSPSFTITGGGITSSTGYINGGNSFGNNATIGLNDGFTLSVKTNNVNRIIVASSGEVGIGTAAIASTALAVGGTTNSTDFLSTSKLSTSAYTLTNPAGTSINWNSRFLFDEFVVGAIDYTTTRTLLPGTGGANHGWTSKGATTDNTNYAFNVTNSSNTSIAYFRNDGDVGINKTSPTATLHIGRSGATGAVIFKTDGSLGGLEMNDYGFMGIGTPANGGNGVIMKAFGSTFFKAWDGTNSLFELTTPSGNNCNLWLYGGGNVTHQFYSAGKSYINNVYGLNIGTAGSLGSTTMLYVKGVGTTTAYGLGVTDNNDVLNFSVKDNGEVSSTLGYWINGTKAVYFGNGITSNLFLGVSAGNNTTSGAANTGIGQNSLASITSGTQNNAMGQNSLYNNLGGGFNIGIGGYSLFTNSTGDNNVGIGYGALIGNTTAIENVGVGGYAGSQTSTGQQNTFLGYATGNSITSGSNNTILGNRAISGGSLTANHIIAIGFGANVTSGLSFSMALGSYATATASNQFVCGSDQGGATINDIVFGVGSESPTIFNVGFKLRPTNVASGQTNQSSTANMTLAGALGTGTGNGSKIILATAKPGSTGSSQNSLTNVVEIDGTADQNVDIVTTNGALILPRLTTTQRNALTAVAGMLIYNTTLSKMQIYTTAWETVTSL